MNLLERIKLQKSLVTIVVFLKVKLESVKKNLGVRIGNEIDLSQQHYKLCYLLIILGHIE